MVGLELVIDIITLASCHGIYRSVDRYSSSGSIGLYHCLVPASNTMLIVVALFSPSLGAL